MLLENRTITGSTTNSEACFWSVSGDQSLYADTAKIVIRVKQSVQTKIYIYSGKNRHNATNVIEGNQTAVMGAPYKVSITDGVIIVVQSQSGSAQFEISLYIQGPLYKWYE